MADSSSVKTVSRKALYDEIWTDSALKVSQKYGVTYSRFLRICKENNIPIPPAGYWTRVESHKPVTKTPLPESKIETIQLITEKERQRDTDEIIAAESIPVLEQEKIGLEIKREGQTSKYDRETLYREVWQDPVTEVAKRYGLSDNGLRKICKKMDVPLPQAGYWTKLRAGKAVTKPMLPKLKMPPVEDKPKIGAERDLHIDNSALSFLNDDDRTKILQAASKLRVAGPGAKLHKDIAAHKQKCENWLDQHSSQENRLYRYNRYAEEKPLMADSLSRTSYSRAFHILDALLKGMLPFGASVTYQFSFQVNGENVPFVMSEMKDQIPHEVTQAERLKLIEYEAEKRKHSWASKPNIPKWEHPWNGRLSLIINGKYKFLDCKSYVLEDRIGEIMVAFYEASYAIRLIRLEKEEKEQQAEEERRRAAEIRERRNHEIEATERLVNAANDYETARRIRAYIEAVKSAGTENAEWIAWASAKADWYDPTIRAKDPYLGIRKHELDDAKKNPIKKYFDW